MRKLRAFLRRLFGVTVVNEEFKQSPVAGALCMLAVGQWARDYQSHITLAAAAFDQCCNGFANVEVSEAAQKELVNLIKSYSKGKK